MIIAAMLATGQIGRAQTRDGSKVTVTYDKFENRTTTNTELSAALNIKNASSVEILGISQVKGSNPRAANNCAFCIYIRPAKIEGPQELRIIIDDGPVIGPLTSGDPYISGRDEGYLVFISKSTLATVAAGRKVEMQLGGTGGVEFSLTAAQLQGLRELYSTIN